MLEFEYADRVALVPDGSVMWDVIDCPNIGGSVLRAPDCEPAVVTALQRVAAALVNEVQPLRLGRYIGGGAGGFVYEYDQPCFAFKEWHRHGYDPQVNYAALKANVLLCEGLKRIGGHLSGKTTYNAPDYYGAYFPYELGGHGLAVWAMSSEPGQRWLQLSAAQHRIVPNEVQRRFIYKRALEACGGDPRNYDLDMDETNELYVLPAKASEASRSVGSATLTIVKLDITDARFSPLRPIPRRDD